MKKRNAPKSRGTIPDLAQEQEAMLKALTGALEQMNISDPAEAQSFLDQFVGMKMPDIVTALGSEDKELDAMEEADACFFEAMEARTPAACKKKLQKALSHDPDHVRALTALALTEKKPEQAELKLRHAIVAGEKKLGSLLQEGHGQLWGYIEARPYMEARAELARFLSDSGRLEEAIEEHQRMLELNENDNQGVRDPLLGLLLESRRYKEARALTKRYHLDQSAVWLYGQALLKFVQCTEEAGWDTSKQDAAWLQQQMVATGKGIAPDLPKALRKADPALIKALEFNPWGAIHLLTMDEHLDDESPQFYTPGSKEEAVLFLEHQAAAWIQHPAAVLWLGVAAIPWLDKNGFGPEFEFGLE